MANPEVIVLLSLVTWATMTIAELSMFEAFLLQALLVLSMAAAEEASEAQVVPSGCLGVCQAAEQALLLPSDALRAIHPKMNHLLFSLKH